MSVSSLLEKLRYILGFGLSLCHNAATGGIFIGKSSKVFSFGFSLGYVAVVGGIPGDRSITAVIVGESVWLCQCVVWFAWERNRADDT